MCGYTERNKQSRLYTMMENFRQAVSANTNFVGNPIRLGSMTKKYKKWAEKHPGAPTFQEYFHAPTKRWRQIGKHLDLRFNEPTLMVASPWLQSASLHGCNPCAPVFERLPFVSKDLGEQCNAALRIRFAA